VSPATASQPALWDAIARPKASSLHCFVDERFETTAWSEVIADAERVAAGLRRAGVREGDRVATVLTNTPAAVRGLLGTWFAGAAVASLPVPARGMGLDEYGEHLGHLCAHVDSPFFVTDERLMSVLPELAGVPTRTWESLSGAGRLEAAPPPDDELAFIQYSSGSTSMPKGCMLTGRAIARQMEILGRMANVEPGAETVASWLPLSHDMGTFGCLVFPLFWDFDLALSSPERFMRSPRTWFGDCADFGATLTAGPNSGVHFAARMQGRARLDRELRLKVCVVGAERIEWSALEAAAKVFGPYGFERKVFLPAYGLAEATLVVSSIGVEDEPSAVHLDTLALADGEIAEVPAGSGTATPMVSVGRACNGVEVRLGEPGRLSEIHLRSPSLASGYYADPERTSERFRDGEFSTGDLGFERDGELYIVGRSDDLLSVAGRNVYARELEAEVERFESVRSGCCTIVDVPADRETRLVMLIEPKDGFEGYEDVAGAAARAATAKAGVTIHECLFLPKGTLPKTPSGKIQRFRCRQLLAGDRFEPIERVELSA
jgi:acyl-CoA synthetase (AMP-forming)/AMP-acid ligase II